MTTTLQTTPLPELRLLVVGLGRSGLSAASFLHARGAYVELADEHIDDSRLITVRNALGDDMQLHREFSASLFTRFDILVVSPGIPQSLPALIAAKEQGVQIIGDIDLFIRFNESRLIAVTGSNGKSTVVAWLGSVLSAANIDATVAGNIGTPALDVLPKQPAVVVLELSSFQLETLVHMETLSAVVLNVSEDHMDRYENFAAYAATKRLIHRDCRHIVVNAEDRETWPQDLSVNESATDSVIADDAENKVGASFSSNRDTQFQNKSSIACFVDSHKDEPWLFAGDVAIMPTHEIRLPGAHNLENALAVIALLLPMNLPVAALREGLAGFTGLTHRTELVDEIDGVRWYNDSKGTNVDACAKAITAMQGPVVLIAGGIAKDADFSPLRDSVSSCVKVLILIGRDAPLLARVLEDIAEIRHAQSMQDAVQIAAECTAVGDVVLLSPACASFDMFDNFEHRGQVFCDEVGRLAA